MARLIADQEQAPVRGKDEGAKAGAAQTGEATRRIETQTAAQ
jgi:hypothetical protein